MYYPSSTLLETFRAGAAQAAGSRLSYPETKEPFPSQIIRALANRQDAGMVIQGGTVVTENATVSDVFRWNSLK